MILQIRLISIILYNSKYCLIVMIVIIEIITITVMMIIVISVIIV